MVRRSATPQGWSRTAEPGRTGRRSRRSSRTRGDDRRKDRRRCSGRRNERGCQRRTRRRLRLRWHIRCYLYGRPQPAVPRLRRERLRGCGRRRCDGRRRQRHVRNLPREHVVQPIARLLLDIRRIRPLLLGFLQRSDLLLLTCDAAVQRRNLRALTEQLTGWCRESKREGSDDDCKHGGASGERRLTVPRPVTIRLITTSAVRHFCGRRIDASRIADARRCTVVCATAAGQRQPTTNRGNADAPA